MATERFSVGFETGTGIAVGAAYALMLAGTQNPVSIHTINVTAATNVGGHIALARAFSVGTGTTVYTGVSHRMANATGVGSAMARIFTAWSSNPTGYVPRLVEAILPVATGSTRNIWDSQERGPLVLEPGAGMLLLNHASGIAGGGLLIDVTWEEGRR